MNANNAYRNFRLIVQQRQHEAQMVTPVFETFKYPLKYFVGKSQAHARIRRQVPL